MNRAELRRLSRGNNKKTKTYNLTQEQIDAIKKEATSEAIREVTDTAFLLMLAIPLEVLITEDYWMKSAKRRIPKFIDAVLEVHQAYERGSISLEEMKADLKEFAGIEYIRKK